MTVKKYIQYLNDTYLCCEILPFTRKVNQYHRSPKKNYVIDNQLIKDNLTSSDLISKKLENFVFTELIKYGYKPNRNIFYYKTRNDYEIDFILKDKVNIKMAIQVSYSFLDNPNTKERELRALKEVSEELGVNNLIIITWKDSGFFEYKGLKIEAISVEEFVRYRLG